MRYYDDETDYPFDYNSVINNADFEDLLEEEDCDLHEVNDDDDVEEWANSYHSIEEEIIEE